MKRDLLQEFVRLRQALVREREQTITRLNEIDAVLGQARPKTVEYRGRRGRNGNAVPLRVTITEVLRDGPLDRNEILRRVQALGYRFSSSNGLNSLSTMLYSNPKLFKRVGGGRFSLT